MSGLGLRKGGAVWDGKGHASERSEFLFYHFLFVRGRVAFTLQRVKEPWNYFCSKENDTNTQTTPKAQTPQVI